MLAYLMLFAALLNVLCLYNAYVFAINFCKCFLFSCIVLVYWHILCLFQILFSIVHSVFNLLVFLILCSHRLFQWKGYVLSGEHFKITIIIK